MYESKEEQMDERVGGWIEGYIMDRGRNGKKEDKKKKVGG